MSEGEIRKQVRDGKVAVIVSSGYGTGWYAQEGEVVEGLKCGL